MPKKPGIVYLVFNHPKRAGLSHQEWAAAWLRDYFGLYEIPGVCDDDRVTSGIETKWKAAAHDVLELVRNTFDGTDDAQAWPFPPRAYTRRDQAHRAAGGGDHVLTLHWATLYPHFRAMAYGEVAS